MSFEVHREPLSKRYYSPIFSSTCGYTILYSFVLVILPLIIAYHSSDFWWKEGYVLEQPDVTYTYQTTIQWYGVDTTDSSSLSYFYSTNAYINQLYSSKVKFPILKSATLDDNRDGKMDRLEMSVALPLAQNELIYGFDCLIYYQSKLSSRAKVLFDSASLITYESGTPMAKVSVDGDLVLRQTYPFNVYGGYRNLYANDPLYDITESTSAKGVSIESIMKRYVARNVTTVFRSNSAYVERRDSYSPNVADIDTEPRYFNASMTIRVPSQTVIYTPPISAVLKFAWIQYMSFFIVVWFLLYQLNSFLFTHKLLPAYATADIVYDKTH